MLDGILPRTARIALLRNDWRHGRAVPGRLSSPLTTPVRSAADPTYPIGCRLGAAFWQISLSEGQCDPDGGPGVGRAA
jgi:hypothetical protein